MFYTALVRSWYGQGLAMPPLRPGFATIIRKNRGDWFASVWNAVKCIGMQEFAGWTEMRSCIKIFHQKETNKKNKKKMPFLPAMMADGSQGLRGKNTLFGE